MCEHKNLRHCKCCGAVFCEDCGEKWFQSVCPYPVTIKMDPIVIQPGSPEISPGVPYWGPNTRPWDTTADGTGFNSPFIIETTDQIPN